MSSLDRGHVADAYRRWLPFVRRALTRLRVRPDDIDDVAQEVFVVMLRKLAPHGDDDNLRGWLYETARRVANNHRRGQGRHDRKVAVAHAMASRAADARPDLAGPLLRLQRVLATLDPEEEVAFRMAIVAGRTGREVAAALQVKPHVAYGAIARVRARLDAAIDHRERRSRVASVIGWLHRGLARVLPQGLPHALTAGAFGLVVVLAPAPAEPSVRAASSSLRAAESNAARSDDEDGLIILVEDDDPSATELEGDDGIIIVVEDDGPTADELEAALAEARGGDEREATPRRRVTVDELEAALLAFDPAPRREDITLGTQDAGFEGFGGTPPRRTTGALEAALLAFDPAPAPRDRGSLDRDALLDRGDRDDVDSSAASDHDSLDRDALLDGDGRDRDAVARDRNGHDREMAVHEHDAGTDPNRVEDGRDAAPTVAREGYWRGRMLRADGTPLARATVRCRRRTAWGGMRRCFDRDHAPLRTDAAGHVLIGPLGAGTYELVAFDEGAVASVYPTVVIRMR